MEKEISVSIIIPAYEIEKAEDAIRHILEQDYKKMEIIVVNDNPKSKPGQSMLEFMKSKKIRLVSNRVNMGIAGSLNEGIKASKNQVISIICTDYFPESKTWLKEVVEKLYSHKNIGCVVSPILWPTEVWKKYNFMIKLFTFRHIAKPQYGGGNYKKEVFDKTGLFNEEKYTFAGEDGDMYNKLKKIGLRFDRIENPIIHLHYDGNSKIRNVLKKEYRYGEAHGALKKEYGITKRVGLFDFEIRLLFLLSFLVYLFIKPSLSLLFLLPFFLASSVQAIRSFIQTKWFPGLVLYPFVGIIIFAVQTAGAISGFLRQNK